MTDTIAKLLGTRKKSEQVDRLKQVMQVADLPGVAITVLFSHGQVTLSVAATTEINSAQAKGILQTAIDSLTRREVMDQIQNERPPGFPQEPELTPEEEELLDASMG